MALAAGATTGKRVGNISSNKNISSGSYNSNSDETK
jgi:hypothetical protein